MNQLIRLKVSDADFGLAILGFDVEGIRWFSPVAFVANPLLRF